MLTLEQARANRLTIDWTEYLPPVPEFLGVARTFLRRPERSRGIPWSNRKYCVRAPLGMTECGRSIARDTDRYIDWSPFFHTWELRGRYPAILEDEVVGTQARELFDDAQKLLRQIVAEKLLTARGVYGFWPANSSGDDVEIYRDEDRREVTRDLPFPASANAKAGRASKLLPGRFRRAEGVRETRLSGRVRGHGGIGADELAQSIPDGARRLQRHPDESAGRPAGGSVRGISASARRASRGVLAQTKT